MVFFFSSRRRHTRWNCDWSSDVCSSDLAGLPAAEHAQVVRASGSGWLRDLDALCVGTAAWRLGAGRARKEDPVSPGAAVICLAKPGEPVTGGQPLLELRTDDPARFDRALDALDGAIEIGAEPPVIGPTVLE